MPPEPPELDLHQAKAELVEKFLKPSLKYGVLSMQPAKSMEEAAERAGRHVHAVGIGTKLVDGVPTRCVRVYVLNKVDPRSVNDVVPRFVNNVPTDVIEASPAFLAADEEAVLLAVDAVPLAIVDLTAKAPPACSSNRQQRQDPVIAGISTGRNGGDFGTIACFCRSTHPNDSSNDDFVLSNSHIFGDTPGADLFQPAPSESNTSPRVHIADLHRSISLTPGGVIPNTVDAAIGLMVTGVPHNRRICSIGPVAGTTTASATHPVMIHGRTSGSSHGTVDDESCDCVVGLRPSTPDVVFLFTNQIRILGIGANRFATFGDSGSLVVHSDSQAAVGLLFAVPLSATDTYAFANPIDEVLSQLSITII